MFIQKTDTDYYVVYNWTIELIYWLEANAKTYHTLPVELDVDLDPKYTGFSMFLMFDDPVDEIAFKLRWI